MTIEAVVETIVTFVKAHESWTAPVAFLVAFGESFCFLSLLVPGTAILAGIAALLAASGIEIGVLTPAIVAAGLGGSLGYAVSFWIGRYFKDSVPRIWPFSTRPHLITQTEEFFATYGAFGVFLGHFFGPVRAVIPVVAGMFGMREAPFQIANVLSAFIWSAGIIAPAFFLVTFKSEVIAFLAAHAGVMLTVLLVLALANSVPRPVLFVPTLFGVIALGSLMILGHVPPLAVWLTGAAGAFLGDVTAYVKGRQHREARASTWPFSASARQHSDARASIGRHGAASLVLSKFQGFNRGLVPLELGNREHPILSFLAASAVSALIWSAVLLLPAIIIDVLIS